MEIEEQCPSRTKEAGLARQCRSCTAQSACASTHDNGDTVDSILQVRMRAIKHIVLILSGKGGVGKSSVAVAMARAAAARSHRVALLDLDLCGPSLPRLMGVEDQTIVSSNEHGMMPAIDGASQVRVMSVGLLMGSAERGAALIWRGPRKTSLIRRLLRDTYWGKLDYLFIDTPPGTSDEHLSIVNAVQQVASLSSSSSSSSSSSFAAIIVTTPQRIAQQTIARELSFCRELNLRVLGVVENMAGFVCPCCKELKRIFSSPTADAAAERLYADEGVRVLGRIPLISGIAQSCDEGIDFAQSLSHVVNAFIEIEREFDQ